MFVIVTDGHENASREWSRQQVFARVKQMEQKGWAFLYLGAHAEAYDQADAIGVAPGNQARWAKSAAGAATVAEQMHVSSLSHRTKLRPHTSLIEEGERRRMDDPTSE